MSECFAHPDGPREEEVHSERIVVEYHPLEDSGGGKSWFLQKGGAGGGINKRIRMARDSFFFCRQPEAGEFFFIHFYFAFPKLFVFFHFTKHKHTTPKRLPFRIRWWGRKKSGREGKRSKNFRNGSLL